MGQIISSSLLVSFWIAAIAATVAPLVTGSQESAISEQSFTGWPRQYEGREIRELTLTRRELAFASDFPGRIGRFSDGDREIIIRWVGAPTRQLHSTADCFRGIGYSIAPLPAAKDANGAAMSCFRATHGSDHLKVCEVIRDAGGESWPDVSAWYWHAIIGSTPPPWWSFVVAERN